VVIEDPIVKNITPSADEEDTEDSDDQEESLAKVSLDDLKKLISKSE
jgi:hypothetical protein